MVCLSVPFPGNLYTSLRCGQWIKQHYPNVKVAMGGGFANTELRSLKDKRVFEFYDFITLDDGEAPIENLSGFIDGSKSIDELKRTFTLVNGEVTYLNNKATKDYKQGEVVFLDITENDDGEVKEGKTIITVSGIVKADGSAELKKSHII